MNRHNRVLFLQRVCQIVDRYLLLWPKGTWNCRSIHIVTKYVDFSIDTHLLRDLFFFFFIITFTFKLNSWEVYPQRSSGQVVVTGVVPPPRYVPSIFIAHRVQRSHCSSIFIEMLLTHALALSANHFFMQEKVPTGMCPRWELNSRNWF